MTRYVVLENAWRGVICKSSLPEKSLALPEGAIP